MSNQNNDTTTNGPAEELALASGSAASPEIYWQAQAFWADGEFDGWAGIGWQTKSKNVIRRVIAEHLAKHPNDTVRVRKVVMHYEAADLTEFLPNTGNEPRSGQSADQAQSVE